ncbi:GIY-YIG nuclease family protein [Bacillus sp. V3B]|uniref:GIY-YIG nuclease family protein n=1 Tax=Bacillus sp. V3B TaxID=2804915 RepID=UPI00210B22F2|nr:GIY-YIG nuclease family protein [Bacillus sp. V3B]MCQ6275153.1 GIY-YIG nuclease family protein [Bacillus sp. V3B]
MLESINIEHTLYTIYLKLDDSQVVSVGKLGEFSFPKGIYIYVGSAKRNLKQRIERHKKIQKKFHWHFDYLRLYGTITRIITYDRRFGECELAENIRKKENGITKVKGFGSSDCKCDSHLIYIGDYH